MHFFSQAILVPGDIVAETKQILQSFKAILYTAGSSIETVVKTNIFLNNIDDFDAVNKIYEECK